MIPMEFGVRRGMWTVQGVKVGAMAAKQFAKNFAARVLMLFSSLFISFVFLISYANI